MPLDQNFFNATKSLMVPGMGTEHIGLLIYSLIRMTRPTNVLEVGMGYTTPFLAMALHDNVIETKADISILTKCRAEISDDEVGRKEVLNNSFYMQEMTPNLHAIDNFAMKESSSSAVLKTIKDLDLESFVRIYESDYKGASRKIDRSCFPIDCIWFDCGNYRDRRNLISEYWDLINPAHGLLILHSAYWMAPARIIGEEGASLSPGPILNELKRQQALRGVDANFEVLSLLEPHKFRQGSVTIVRKLPPVDKVRQTSYTREVEELFDDSDGWFPEL